MKKMIMMIALVTAFAMMQWGTIPSLAAASSADAYESEQPVEEETESYEDEIVVEDESEQPADESFEQEPVYEEDSAEPKE